jgi:hypothetical protein
MRETFLLRHLLFMFPVEVKCLQEGEGEGVQNHNQKGGMGKSLSSFHETRTN